MVEAPWGSRLAALLRVLVGFSLHRNQSSLHYFLSVIQLQTKGHLWESVWVGRDFPSGSSGLACDGVMGGAMKNYIQRRELLEIPRIKGLQKRWEFLSRREFGCQTLRPNRFLGGIE